MKASKTLNESRYGIKNCFAKFFSRSSKMFKSNLGLGTKLGAAANKSDLNVSLFYFFVKMPRHIITFLFTHVFENDFCNNTCHQKA